MAVSDRMVLLVRVLAVFAVNAVLGLAASAASTAAAGNDLRLAGPDDSGRGAGAGGGDARAARPTSASLPAWRGWVMTVLAGHGDGSAITAATTSRDSALLLPYLAFAALARSRPCFRARPAIEPTSIRKRHERRD